MAQIDVVVPAERGGHEGHGTALVQGRRRCRSQGRAAARARDRQGHRGNSLAGDRQARRDPEAAQRGSPAGSDPRARADRGRHPRRQPRSGERRRCSRAGCPRPRRRPSAARQPARAQPLSPAVRRLLNDMRCRARADRGSGRDGRITVQDVERHLDQKTLEASASGDARHHGENAPAPGGSRVPRRRAAACRTRRCAGGWPSTWRAVSRRRRT